MGQSAIGIIDETELAEMAQDVPAEIKSKQCSLCLWAGVECRSGSLLGNTEDHLDCKAYTYYN